MVQSPRAKNAFSSAWAARTWPAPDVAESKRTRGLALIGLELADSQMASRGFAVSRGEALQDAAPEFLQFPEARQIILKIVIQELRLAGLKLGSQNHVAQFDRVRKQRVFLQLLQGKARIVVIHGFPLRETKAMYTEFIVPGADTRGDMSVRAKSKNAAATQAAVAAAG